MEHYIRLPLASLFSTSKSMRVQWNRLVQLWESAQVELHGKYSTERVLKLAQYTRETSYLHAFIVLVLTPLPCLVVTVLVDVLPLADPSEGVAANKMFFIRDQLVTYILTFICISQFRVSLPVLPYPIWRAFCHSVWISALCMGTLFTVATTTGFPFPFSLMAMTPPWVTLISISLAYEWLKKIRETPGAPAMVINVFKVWMCQVMLEFIYPPYYYIFTTLSDSGQAVFAVLLPVIKLAMRNVFARTVVHLSDEMPEVIVFNVELFNALFVSYCMQNSPSFWTTLELMSIDIGMIILSLRDMENIRIGLKDLEQRIDKDKSWGTYCNSISETSTMNRAPNTLERTKILLEQQIKSQPKSNASFLELVRVASSEFQVTKGPGFLRPRNLVGVLTAMILPKSAPPPAANTNAIRVHPAPSLSTAAPASNAAANVMKKISVKVRYTRKVQRLLYLAEFLLLLNYVEIVIPLVFSTYMVATYKLPNREYYAQLHGMTQSELIQTLQNVMFYCSLQICSLLLLVIILHKQLGLSPIHQLAFVLEKQCAGVQIRLVFWVFYNAQASLQHNGYDYTFRFQWLNNTTSSGSGSM